MEEATLSIQTTEVTAETDPEAIKVIYPEAKQDAYGNPYYEDREITLAELREQNANHQLSIDEAYRNIQIYTDKMAKNDEIIKQIESNETYSTMKADVETQRIAAEELSAEPLGLGTIEETK